MPDPNEPFTPPFVDEQITQLIYELEQNRQTGKPEKEMLQDIQSLYRAYAGTRDRVRQRLQEQITSKSETEVGTLRSLSSVKSNRQRIHSMQTNPKIYTQSHTIKPRLALLAATLFAVLLVVALIVVVPFVRSNFNQPGPTASPGATPGTTVSPSVSPTSQVSGNIYIGTSQGILKLDPVTGATLRSYPWDRQLKQPIGTIMPYTLQTDGKLLYIGVNINNSEGHLFYAGVEGLDPNTGKTWSYLAPTNDASTMAIANGKVYVSVDDPASTGIISNSLVFALEAAHGTQLTSYYKLPVLVDYLTAANGFLYARGNGNLYGVNLVTRETWSQIARFGVNQGFSTFQIMAGVLYTTAYQGTGSRIKALRPETGALLWQSQEIPGRIFNFTIAQKVIYFGTDSPLPGVSVTPECSCDGRFDAYDLQQHKLLWEQSVGSVAQAYTVFNGVVYAVIYLAYAGGPVSPALIALSTDHGKLLWHAPTDLLVERFDPVVFNDRVYIVGGTIQAPGHQVLALAPTSGQHIWQMQFPGPISAFLVVK